MRVAHVPAPYRQALALAFLERAAPDHGPESVALEDASARDEPDRRDRPSERLGQATPATFTTVRNSRE